MDEVGRNGVPTMAAVARRAGVSTATVSRVVHDNPRVREDTRVKVQDAIRALGYTPHLGAQELASGKTHVIGAVVNTIANPVEAATVRGIEERFNSQGYRLLVANSDCSPEVEERLLRTYLSISCSGIITVASWCDSAVLTALPAKDVPIVLINPDGNYSHNFGLPTIRIDGVLGGLMAGRHLIELGHRRIGFVGRSPIGALQIARVEGLRQAVEEAGLPWDPELVVSEEQPHAGYLGIQRLLQKGSMPSAVFCYHDLTAFEAMEALKQARLRVPEEVSVIGFDDVFMSEYLSLTTLAQPFVEMGRLAAQVILDHLAGQSMRLADICVIPTLVRRGSTAPPRGRMATCS